MKNIDYTKTLQALNMLKVETGSLACLGCEYENHCSINGCAILRDIERHLVLAMATESFLQCSNCEYWSRNDPRCMCEKSPYIGLTVRPDNYCSCVSVDMLAASEEARSDLARQLAAARKQVDELTKAGLIATDKANQAIAEMDAAKADSVTVIRCRDCKYSRPNGELYECPFFDEIRGDEFCSSGERKEGID